MFSAFLASPFSAFSTIELPDPRVLSKVTYKVKIIIMTLYIECKIAFILSLHLYRIRFGTEAGW
jgi:hypothetical protein